MANKSLKKYFRKHVFTAADCLSVAYKVGFCTIESLFLAEFVDCKSKNIINAIKDRKCNGVSSQSEYCSSWSRCEKCSGGRIDRCYQGTHWRNTSTLFMMLLFQPKRAGAKRTTRNYVTRTLSHLNNVLLRRNATLMLFRYATSVSREVWSHRSTTTRTRRFSPFDGRRPRDSSNSTALSTRSAARSRVLPTCGATPSSSGSCTRMEWSAKLDSHVRSPSLDDSSNIKPGDRLFLTGTTPFLQEPYGSISDGDLHKMLTVENKRLAKPDKCPDEVNTDLLIDKAMKWEWLVLLLDRARRVYFLWYEFAWDASMQIVPIQIYAMMGTCWSIERKDRPSFTGLISFLASQMAVPPSPVPSCPSNSSTADDDSVVVDSGAYNEMPVEEERVVVLAPDEDDNDGTIETAMAKVSIGQEKPALVNSPSHSEGSTDGPPARPTALFWIRFGHVFVHG